MFISNDSLIIIRLKAKCIFHIADTSFFSLDKKKKKKKKTQNIKKNL
jgi:hypothetical protein